MLAHVCVAYAPDGPARWALGHAVRLARRWDARLTVVHVAPPVDEVLAERAGLAGELLGVGDDVRLRRRLLGTVLPLTAGVATDVRVFTGRPAPTLVELLRADRPGLVVAGARERRGAGRWATASVADALLAEAPCPVTLVRSPPRESRPVVLVLAGRASRDDGVRRTAQALAHELRAGLVDHPAPRHSPDAAGLAAVAAACGGHRPLLTVIDGERWPGARRRLGISRTATVGRVLESPLVVIPPSLRRASSPRTRRLRPSSRPVARHGLLPAAHRSRALR